MENDDQQEILNNIVGLQKSSSTGPTTNPNLDVAATSDNAITRMLYRARTALDEEEQESGLVPPNEDHDEEDEEDQDGEGDDDEDLESEADNNNNNNSGGNDSKDNSGAVVNQQEKEEKRKRREERKKRKQDKKNLLALRPLQQSEASKIINQPYSIRIEAPEVEEIRASDALINALKKREKYKAGDIDKGGKETRIPPHDEQNAINRINIRLNNGVYTFDGMETPVVSWENYIDDLVYLFSLLEVGPWLSLAKTRLTALEEKFELFTLLNADLEETFDTHFGGGGVFGRSLKIDNAVRLNTCMTADVLVENIRLASRHRAAEVVHIDQNGAPMTFRDVAEELGIDASTVTAEGLGLHPPARKEPSKRYDVLDPEANPAGTEGVELLSLFLELHGSTNNGRFFADLVRPVLEKRETTVSTPAAQMTSATLNIAGEYKLPILGMRLDEWSAVARWITDHSFTQMTKAMFSIEIPRIERKRHEYDCRNTEEQLRNIFYPMFMATLRPGDPEYHSIAVALMKVGSICISSDEKLRRTNFSKDVRPPGSIHWSIIPDDYYFFYYVWANLCSLNALRRKLGLNTFQFRTISSEETPHWDQLVVSFLLADVVEQGGRLIGSWPLQYLFYMARIGMTISPISSNGAGVSFFDSPFGNLFKRGLLCSISTGDPLHFHHNGQDPLLEEYGTTQSMFELSTADSAELARNSILISNFPSEFKANWLGASWFHGVDGHDSSKSHVSDVRIQFRHECLLQEQQTLNHASSQLTAQQKAQSKKPLSINMFQPSIRSSAKSSFLNPFVAKLREMQRMNSIDRRIPLTRIVIDGPAVGNAQTIRNHANLLRGAITLRGRYQLHSDPTLTGDLFLDNNSQKSDGNNNNNNNQNTKKGDGSNNTGQGDFLHSAGSTHVLKKHNSVFFDGVNVLNGAFSSNHNNNNNNIAGLSRYQSLGNLSLATNVTSGVFGGLGEGGSESADPDSPNGMTIGAASFRFGGDEDGALERAFKINTKGSGSSFDPSQWTFNMYYGVVLIHTVGTAPSWPEYIPTFDMFMQDVAYLRQLVTENSALSEFCLQRLKLLEHKFGLHLALNISKECGEVKDRELNNRDFYTAHKVDNNVQTEACMNARVLFHFFTERARNGSGDVVFERNNKPVTLRQYLTELNVDVERLTVDELTNLLQSHQQLRALFLSPDNYMGGRYFAEITKHMLEQYKNDKFSFVENRLPIYGRSRSEWDVLASWCDRYGMVSPQNRWMARVSRGYRHLHRDGHVDNFGDYLDNIFIPLWEVSLNPAKFPRLHHFLTYVSGFDCEGNEQKVDKTMENIPPHEWHSPQNPPYNYYVYYLWANITALNVFRRQRGLNVFSFRPQSGESGSLDHLIGSFLAADGISHGVQLIHSPTLQYLFYITQFPVAMSPLSNTTVIPYLDHPFAHFFSRGLNVSLATDKPLFNHFTSEPLIEEYSLASKIWKLQNGDLSELARNSVRMSDFSSQWKKKALGPLCSLHSCLGNDYKLSRVSDFRVAYRYETYHAELDYLDEVVAMEDLRMWIHCAAAGQFGEDSSSDRWTRVNGKSEANKNLVITPSQQQQQQRKRMSQQNNKPQRGASKLAQLLMLGVEGDDNNNNNDGDTTTGGGVSSKSKEKSSLLDRAKSSRIPPQQLIVASESQLLPFPRAMLPLEIELELYQQRMGTKVYFPAAFGSQQSDGEAEEAISRAALTAQLKQQLADMDRDLQLKKLEVDRMSDTQFSLATDIKSVRTKIAALAATPTTSIDAGLGQQSSSAVVVSSGTPNNNNNNNTASSTTENK